MPDSRAILVVDLAFGDCGKGTIVDYLARARNAHTVVRFNGGPQAGHNVITPDGRHHTFSQFGAATFNPGVRTVLSRFMLIEPYALLNEAAHLHELGVPDALARLQIDARCPVISPAQQCANRLREIARGDRAHGTCGMGVGETVQDLFDHPSLVIRAGDLRDRATILQKLRALRELKLEQLRPQISSGTGTLTFPLDADSEVLPSAGSIGGDTRLFGVPQNRRPNRSGIEDAILNSYPDLETLLNDSWIEVAADNYQELARHVTIADEDAMNRALRRPGLILFEGAQGVLLDESFGFHPHTTWSNCTFANADTLLNEAGHDGQRTRVGVLRAYFTRHGAGPFVTEESSLRDQLREPHNIDAGWQRNFRVGPFDAVAARYALASAGGVDCLAVTHLDRLSMLPPRLCTKYQFDKPDDEHWDATNLAPTSQLRNPSTERDPEIAPALLTSALFKCKPVYTPASTKTPDAYLEALAGQLQSPVGITSLGPRANEKQMRENF